MREQTMDQFQRLSPRPHIDQPVRVVDIDEAALARFGQWPWPRDRLAELVDKLDALGAAAIAFDMAFAEPDRLSPARLMQGMDSNRCSGTSPSLRPSCATTTAPLPTPWPIVPSCWPSASRKAQAPSPHGPRQALPCRASARSRPCRASSG
jgi:CHASE2 domain-containing sensor protein